VPFGLTQRAPLGAMAKSGNALLSATGGSAGRLLSRLVCAFDLGPDAITCAGFDAGTNGFVGLVGSPSIGRVLASAGWDAEGVPPRAKRYGLFERRPFSFASPSSLPKLELPRLRRLRNFEKKEVWRSGRRVSCRSRRGRTCEETYRG
jgi:hypothetical protein